MPDIAETLAQTIAGAHHAVDEVADCARVLLRAQTQVDRRVAMERLDAARGRLDRGLAMLRGDLVRVYVREEESSAAEEEA
jgi:hypothetical protein